MPSFSDDQANAEYFPLSLISQYGFCPRRCGLLAVNMEWEDNEFTISGALQHQKVHSARIERKGNAIYLYEFGVFSKTIGVNGYCDCIEAHIDENGIPIPYGEGSYSLYPIEYKHGVVRDEEEYKLQLCAQAMCLEEQFKCNIPKGAIFYIDSHRRSEVVLTNELRKNVLKTSEEIRRMIENNTVPLPNYSAKCKKCSMSSSCQPKLCRDSAEYCERLWKEVLSKEGDAEI